MTDAHPQLLAELERIIATGTEPEARAFVIQHFKEFPEEAQKEFAVGLLSDALDEDLAGREALAQLKKEAIEGIDLFEASEKED